MNKVIVQIYEIQEPREAEKAVELGVDHVGTVVLDPERWKQPALKDVVRVVADAGAKSSIIPLFCDADTISRMLDFYQPDIIHFCERLPLGRERRKELDRILSVQRIVKQRFPEIDSMRSVPVGPSGDDEGEELFSALPVLEPLCDWFLTDTELPAEDERPVEGFIGITGVTSNWDIAAKLVERAKVPVILAGGMSPENVYDGIMHTRPAGVDSCTLTNARDNKGRPVRFKKDFDLVERFVKEARRAEAALSGLRPDARAV
ncbi:MAG: hypothetical protein DRH32_03295 [Deltaproteobacteria bacterium]|nr:MAG: hypothetical protein DRH32_03295 [Deltaproteobacteria bacterium]